MEIRRLKKAYVTIGPFAEADGDSRVDTGVHAAVDVNHQTSSDMGTNDTMPKEKEKKSKDKKDKKRRRQDGESSLMTQPVVQ